MQPRQLTWHVRSNIGFLFTLGNRCIFFNATKATYMACLQQYRLPVHFRKQVHILKCNQGNLHGMSAAISASCSLLETDAYSLMQPRQLTWHVCSNIGFLLTLGNRCIFLNATKASYMACLQQYLLPVHFRKQVHIL